MNKAAWKELVDHQKTLEGLSLRSLFLEDPDRFQHFSVCAGDILLDYSKQRVTDETLEKLVALAIAADLPNHRERLLTGDIVNLSEQRPALHTALRGSTDKKQIQSMLDKMQGFVEDLHAGKCVGATQKQITDVISLGIGGSELGPSMVCEALNAYRTTNIRFHFVSNVDGKTLANVLSQLNPETTLCIINSKTFTTPETLLNAKAVKAWLSAALSEPSALKHHLIAVTANPERARSFGIPENHVFEFWDFVGGRYSIWSAVGLPVAIMLGMSQFKEFLKGASEMDDHFQSAPLNANMPVLMALLGIWNINFWGNKTLAIIPYDDGLKQLPAYLQQLEMESNGKSVSMMGEALSYSTAPVIWGGVGCNGQHAYMQLLHQGTEIIPVDFLMAAKGHVDFDEQQDMLVASCLSQSKALMEGTPSFNEKNENNRHKACVGNRPSSTLMYPKLTPKVLGSLLALYEHKVFTQGVLWGINSFDQWGVELGKNLIKDLLPNLKKNPKDVKTDSSTQGLMAFFQTHQMKKE